MTKSKKAKIIPVILLLAVAVLLVFLLAGEGEITEYMVSGTVEAREVDISPKIAGRIDLIYADEGDTVSDGELLLQMDDRQLRLQVQQAEAGLKAAQETLADLKAGAREEEIASARAAYEAAKAAYKKAKNDLKRAQVLYEEETTSEDHLERAELQLENAEKNMDMAREMLELLKAGSRKNVIESARYNVQQAEKKLDEIMLLQTESRTFSPIDGVVTIRSAEPGEVIAAGTPVLTVINPADCYVKIYISEKYLGRVKIGQDVEILTDSFEDKTFSGKLIFISSEAEFTPRNIQTQEERVKLVFAAKVKIDNRDLLLKPGMPVDVKIDLLTAKDI